MLARMAAVRRIRWLRFLWSILVFALFPAAAAPSSPARPRVVATILPAYCIATNIGRDLVEVGYLVGAGGNGHDYQLTPRDRSEIERARLLLMNGLGIEPWLKKTLAAVPASVRVVSLSQGLESRLLAIEHRHAHGPGEKHDHAHDEFNPHLWLDPTLMMQMVTNALRGFRQMDPQNAGRYATNAAEFIARVQAIDRELMDGLAGLRGVSIVTFHDAFPYFARRYGINVAGVIEEIPDVDPTPRHLAKLSATIRAAKARAIFVEPRHSRRLADRLGRDLGIKVGVLDTLEGGPASATAYEEGMRNILRNLQSTLR
jgi:zinc transport system substrate-binding protein